MHIHCPTCGGSIPAADVDLSTGLAKCRRCDAVFNIRSLVESESRQPPGGRINPAAPGPVHALPAPKPARVHVEQFGATLTLRWRWFRPLYLGLLFFCVAWDSFLIFWYSMALSPRHHAPVIMVIFPIAHVAVGIGLTYTVIAGFLNSTSVTVSPDALTVRHAPLPWAGNRTLPAGQVAQLYCGRTVTTGKNGMSIAYDLLALLRDGTKVKLATGFTDPDEPRFLEQQVERHLRLPNRPVAGEYAG